MNGYRASLEIKIKRDAMRDPITRRWAQEPAERPSSHECVVELEALLSAVKAGSRKPTAVLNRTKSLLNLAAVVTRKASFESFSSLSCTASSFSPSALKCTLSFAPSAPSAPSGEPLLVAQRKFSESFQSLRRTTTAFFRRSSLDVWSASRASEV
ncbi:hypothetical protein T484DRAFT_1835145 [Baffinella frigidus]|nr:hypothetical protein T484DRAFT_1835145 [Cryptophyta sp. CCMP2293]